MKTRRSRRRRLSGQSGRNRKRHAALEPDGTCSGWIADQHETGERRSVDVPVGGQVEPQQHSTKGVGGDEIAQSTVSPPGDDVRVTQKRGRWVIRMTGLPSFDEELVSG